MVPGTGRSHHIAPSWAPPPLNRLHVAHRTAGSRPLSLVDPFEFGGAASVTPMDIPPKRHSNRSERRAAQRGTAPDTRTIPAPPENQCEAWHYYWCESHQEWHHHDESAIEAIQASLTPD